MFQSSVNMSPGDPTHKWAPTEFNLWHSVGPATNKQSSSVSCFFSFVALERNTEMIVLLAVLKWTVSLSRDRLSQMEPKLIVV